MGKSQTQNQFDWKVSQSSRSPRPCCECIRGRSEPIGRNLLSRWLGCLKVGHVVTSLDGSSYQWRIRITSIWNLAYAPTFEGSLRWTKCELPRTMAVADEITVWILNLSFPYRIVAVSAAFRNRSDWLVSELFVLYPLIIELTERFGIVNVSPRRSLCFVLVLWSNSISTRCLLLILQHL